MSPIEFAASLLAYCYATGGSVTSWGRSQLHNKNVGGHPGSYHLLWIAADVVYDTPPDLPAAEIFARRFGLEVIREVIDQDAPGSRPQEQTRGMKRPIFNHDHLEPLPRGR